MWMNKKMTRIIALIISLIMILGVILIAFGSLSNAEEIDENTTIQLSLDEAKAYAKANNYDLKIANLEKDNIELTKKIAKEAEDYLDDMYSVIKGTETFETYKVRNGYTLLAAKNAEKLLELGNSLSEKATEMAVETAYYNLSEKLKIYEIKTETLNLIKEQLKISEQKLEMGNISEVTYKSMLLEQYAAEMDLNNAETQYKEAVMGFNKILNLPLEQKILLTTNVEHVKYEMPLFNEKLLELKNESIGYKQLLLDKELLDLELKLSRAYKGTSSKEYKQVVNKTKINEIELKKKEIELEYNLKNDINRILGMEKTIKTSEQSMLLANIVLEITKLRSTLGMATELDVIEAELSAREAQVRYIQSVHGYNIIITKFINNI